MQWPGRSTWAAVLLLGQACFSPNDNQLATDTESSSTSVTITDTGATDSSPTQPSDTGTGDSVDTSASSDPDSTSDDTLTASTTSASTTASTVETSSEGDSTTGAVPGPCDTFDPMCPVGFKCSIWASDGGDEWDEMFCLPLDPAPVGEGEACTVQGGPATGVDDCDAGLVCWEVDTDTNEGTCFAFCSGELGDPMCDGASACVQFNSEVINLCLPFCDPLIQDCPPNQGCYPVNDGFICANDVSGGAVFGSECMFINSCAPGLFCGNPDIVPNCPGAMGGCCSAFCDITDALANESCPAFASGQQCIAWFEEGLAPPGFEDVGACALPF